MKNKVIFLDRDGTINIDYGYVHEKDKLTFIEGAVEGLKQLNNLGYKLIIITNQSGINRKYFTYEEYLDFNNYLIDQLKEHGVVIEKTYCCPHIDNDNCECRKPKLKLFKDAIEEYNVDLDNSFAIGDKERDLSICDNTNIKGILFGDDSTKYFCLNNWHKIVEYIKNIGSNHEK